MRTRVHLFVYAANQERALTRALTAAGNPEPVDLSDIGGFYTFRFWEGAPELDQLRAALAEHGVHTGERRELVFTERELSEAPFLLMYLARSPKGSGGPTYGTSYDLSDACPRCGTGAIQTSPLILKKSDTPVGGDAFITGHGEVLVSPYVGHVLDEECVSGLELWEAVAWKTGEPLGWRQLVAKHQMPAWARETAGGEREDPCPACGRDGYFDSPHRPLRVAYRSSDIALDRLPDVAVTFERFGNSRLAPTSPNQKPGLWLAQPLLLVRPRVRAILKRLRIRGLRFEPIRLV